MLFKKSHDPSACPFLSVSLSHSICFCLCIWDRVFDWWWFLQGVCFYLKVLFLIPTFFESDDAWRFLLQPIQFLTNITEYGQKKGLKNTQNSCVILFRVYKIIQLPSFCYSVAGCLFTFQHMISIKPGNRE